MKKLFLAIICVLFTFPTFALTLTGTVTDYLDSEKKLSDVSVTIGEESATTDIDGEFEIEEFSPNSSQTISFSKGGYYEVEGEIIKKDGELYYDESALDPITNAENQVTGYKMPDISLMPEPVEIISGKIIAKQDGSLQTIDPQNITITVNPEGFLPSDWEVERYGEEGLKYVIKGVLGKNGEPQEYNVKFEYNSYEPVIRDFNEIEDSVFTDEDKTTIKFDITSIAEEEERNMTEMTGFECQELLPKYLVGASCVENRELKGDASDLSLWIQKFGSKITALIGIIAVVLIVWNAFNLVTAAGDTDKITQGKNGIIWTIVGLALTMFAYVIVKTVIVLTYTQ